MTEIFPAYTDELPQDPHITIYVHAIGALCFNQDDNRAELGVLNLEEHSLVISVYDSEGNPVQGIHKQPITTRDNYIGSDSGTIERFHSEGSADSYNFMMKLTEIYGPDISFAPTPEKWRAKFFFQDAVFAVDPASHVEATPFRIGDGQEKDMRIMGRAIKILTKSTNGFLRLGDRTFELPADQHFEIVIRNGTCPGREGDFQHLFDVLEGTADTRHNLMYGAGEFPWLSPAEKKEARRLPSQLEAFLNDPELRKDLRSRDDLAEKLDALVRVVRCREVPCEPPELGKLGRLP